MVYSQDILVAWTAETQHQVINLKGPETLFESGGSRLMWHPLMITCFPDAAGCEVGCIEGELRFWLSKMDRCQISCTFRLHFWFKCHRTSRNSVTGAGFSGENAIAFDPAHGTFPTVGTDGMLH
ncbi:hypothetical protein HOY80DRAFT_882441 [Tuber brumale]|nr:hypothetical protein HOY80DRAFT_882441 [Tuber brumale]